MAVIVIDFSLFSISITRVVSYLLPPARASNPLQFCHSYTNVYSILDRRLLLGKPTKWQKCIERYHTLMIVIVNHCSIWINGSLSSYWKIPDLLRKSKDIFFWRNTLVLLSVLAKPQQCWSDSWVVQVNIHDCHFERFLANLPALDGLLRLQPGMEAIEVLWGQQRSSLIRCRCVCPDVIWWLLTLFAQWCVLFSSQICHLGEV